DATSGAGDPVHPGHSTPDLRRRWADQAREPDGLAGTDGQGDVANDATDGQVLDGEKLGARAVLDTREEGLERAARHEFHQRLLARAADVERGDPAAVAEHSDAIADAVDLVHAVGAVDDPHSSPLALPEE